MKIGVQIQGVRPDGLLEMAQAIERFGFESIWRGDHVAFPAEIPMKYPYDDGGTPPFPPNWPMLDTAVLFGWLAAHTTRLKFGTGIYILPLRKPVLVARAFATVDVLARGRMIFGVGVGWMEPEFQIVGEEFHDRGRRADEMIAVIRQLWSGESASFEGEHYQLPAITFKPRPAQPTLPIIIGGESPAALRRAARLGDGWYGVGDTPEGARIAIGRMNDLRAEYGRADEPFDNTILLNRTGQTLDSATAAQYAAAGVNRLVLGFGSTSTSKAALADLEDAAERLRDWLD
jgi:probable F420-dependent oxidoreductase